MMDSKVICALLVCFAAQTSASSVKRGICISFCGNNGVQCPTGYECSGNGCGHQCYRRDDYSQPEGCPSRKCAYNCELGYTKDKNGCDTCTCDYSALQTHEFPKTKRGVCISFCGHNGVKCPSGYDCLSNGCGHQCYRGDDYSQPEGCPLLKCSHNCELGYTKDGNGCETCSCDYSPLQNSLG